jgi:hypothetical protein
MAGFYFGARCSRQNIETVYDHATFHHSQRYDQEAHFMGDFRASRGRKLPKKILFAGGAMPRSLLGRQIQEGPGKYKLPGPDTRGQQIRSTLESNASMPQSLHFYK